MSVTKAKEMKSNLIQVRLDNKTKAELELVLSKLGLNTSQAVLMYIKQIILKNGIPFEITATSNDLNLKETSVEEFRKMTATTVKRLDEGEEIPEMHKKNERPFIY
jgi:DNA-damage-inducible protein J